MAVFSLLLLLLALKSSSGYELQSPGLVFKSDLPTPDMIEKSHATLPPQNVSVPSLCKSELEDDDPHGNDGTPFEENPLPVKFRQPHYEERILAEVLVFDAECQFSEFVSHFKLFIATLSNADEILQWTMFDSEEFEYVHDEHMRFASIVINTKGLKKCFRKDPKMCVPHGHVVFINYYGMPTHTWKFHTIEVDVYFAFGPKEGDRHAFNFQISNLRPCSMIIDQRGWYQIGPKIGTMKKLKKRPEIGDRVW